jgi:hypothetical protein
VSAREALRRYLTVLLENPRADLPTSLRSYLIRFLAGVVRLSQENQSEVIKHMLRDVGIVAMLDVGAERWPSLPRLNSTARRHSLAWFVAEVMSNYRLPLAERHIGRIYQDRAKLASRLRKFLLGEQTI